jgi:hypothetical protein
VTPPTPDGVACLTIRLSCAERWRAGPSPVRRAVHVAVASSRRFIYFASALAITPAGQRIRAPPWLLAAAKPIARALLIARRGRGRSCFVYSSIAA